MVCCSEEDSAALHFPLLSSMKNFCEVSSHEMQIFPSSGSVSKIEMQSATHFFESEDSLAVQASLSMHL